MNSAFFYGATPCSQKDSYKVFGETGAALSLTQDA
jgi:hypothetical protein